MSNAEIFENRRIRSTPAVDGRFSLSYFAGDGSNYPPDGSYLNPQSQYRYRFMDMSAWIGRSLGNDGIVVDIGGGPGHLGYWMKNHYPEIQVIHTDYSHDALVFGRKMYPHEAIQLSAKNIPFPNDFAHGVLFADVLEHLDPDSASQALAESYRILKEGGHLFINIPNRITWSRKTFFEPSHLWIPTIRDMITAVKKHGFEAIDVSTRGFPWSTMLRSWTGNDLHLPVGGTSIFLHATKA